MLVKCKWTAFKLKWTLIKRVKIDVIFKLNNNYRLVWSFYRILGYFWFFYKSKPRLFLDVNMTDSVNNVML